MTTSSIVGNFPSGYGTTANTTEYWMLGGAINVRATESMNQVIFRQAGKLSKFFVRLSANSIAAVSTLNLRKNTANGNQVLSVAASTTGNFEDTTNTDVVAAGDKINIRSVPGASTGTLLPVVTSLLLDVANTTVTREIATYFDASSTTASTTFFAPVSGTTETVNANTTEIKCRQRLAGTFTNLMQSVQSNARTIATTFNGRKNGANGTLTLSVGNVATGFFEDTTHSDSVAVADDYDYAYTTGTGSQSIVLDTTAADFTSTANYTQIMSANSIPRSMSGSATNYLGIGGVIEPYSTVEADNQLALRVPYTFSNLTINVTGAPTNTATLTFRKNTANGNQTVSITTSGIFSDTTHTDITVVTDIVNYALVNGASTTAIVGSICVWGTAAVLISQTVFVEWEES